MKDGIYKVAAGTPEVHLCDTDKNAEEIIKLIKKAEKRGVKVLVLPELCITGYTAGDLFILDRLTENAETALKKVAASTEKVDMLVVVGVGLVLKGKLYSTAAVISHGKIIGIVPKKNIPNYSEFYEGRMFTGYTGENYFDKKWNCFVGRNLIFRHSGGLLTLAAEVCEDLWVADSPSISHALNGALLICNPSASDETIGKGDYRKNLVAMQSAKLSAAYVYADAGKGESTTDTVYAGHNIIAENGAVLAEGKLFEDELIVADIDVKFLAHERRRMTSFNAGDGSGYEEIEFELKSEETKLEQPPYRNPFVPSDADGLSRRAEEILRLQTAGLRGRLLNVGIKKMVVGVSGGLDSTLALLVAIRAADSIGLSRDNITAVTMPCFGTTKRTRSNAEKMCEIAGVNFRTVNITDSVKQHLKDIGHDGVTTDVTYENAQARERTQVLFDIANHIGGILIGTGDLSELALGWCTYNGDHMSSYAVNASVPKTLVRHLVAYEAKRLPELKAILEDVLATPVSPELLPTNGKDVVQPTEEIVGPYELHDFFLYQLIRRGSDNAKTKRLAMAAFKGIYDEATIDKWLSTFTRRFYSSAFKRSCLPDGAKVGSVSLSPRGDWRMPSDAKSF